MFFRVKGDNMTNLEKFLTYLGWIPGEDVHIIRIYGKGISEFYQIRNKKDLIGAEKLIEKFNGSAQIYVTVNPCTTDIPADSFGGRKYVKCVRNVYLDIDSEHPKDNPANQEEINRLGKTVAAINKWLKGMGVDYHQDFSGNGWRYLIPIPDSHNDIEMRIKYLTESMKKKYPEIDGGIWDCARITGVPGTLNVKTEVEGRENRLRDNFIEQERVTNKTVSRQLWDIELPDVKTEFNENISISDDMIDDLVALIIRKFPLFNNIVKKAAKASKGKRSEIDFRMCHYLANIGVDKKTATGIMWKYATDKVRENPKYLMTTIKKIYGGE